jgi:hypothetical protein
VARHNPTPVVVGQAAEENKKLIRQKQWWMSEMMRAVVDE